MVHAVLHRLLSLVCRRSLDQAIEGLVYKGHLIPLRVHAGPVLISLLNRSIENIRPTLFELLRMDRLLVFLGVALQLTHGEAALTSQQSP